LLDIETEGIRPTYSVGGFCEQRHWVGGRIARPRSAASQYQHAQQRSDEKSTHAFPL
jgi:hypothetical protein